MKQKISVTALCLCLAISIVSASAHQPNRLRPGFFRGKLSLSPAPQVGQQAALNLDLTPVAGDCQNATIQFRAPAGVVMLGRAVFDGQNLTKGSSLSYSTDIMILEEGNYALQATVYFQISDDRQAAEHFFFYLQIGEARPQMSGATFFPTTAGGSTGFDPAFMLAPSAISLDPADSAAGVRGYVTYYNDNQRQELPIKGVKVEAFERIGSNDQSIEVTYTNYEGFYSFKGVTNGDLQGQTGRNIWLRVWFDNDVLEIVNSEDAFYVSDSPITYRTSDGYVNSDFVWSGQNQYRGLGHIFNCIMDAHDFLQRHLNWRRNKITVRWPYGDWSRYDYKYFVSEGTVSQDYIFIPAGIEWTRMIMLHEYGHAVMTALYGYNAHILPQTSFSEGHSIYTVSDPGFAMQEGWAEFFGALVDDSAFNVTAYSNLNFPNVESNEWWTGAIEGGGNNTRGEIVEGAVASILWDIVDTDQSYDGSPGEDDDEIQGMVQEIWNLMMYHRPSSILEFWDHWIENGYGHSRSLYSIFADHGMEVIPPWDVNRDGLVNYLDLALIGFQFGREMSSPGQINPDVNRDKVVDVLDLILWAGSVKTPAQ